MAPPQGDIDELKIHLGCTKEVSSFEAQLKNWDSKYLTSPNVIAVAQDGHIDLGRGSNVPQLITCRVEELEYLSDPYEHYVRVSGRCWGERLFRQFVTKTYELMKGEDIVRDVIDYYVGLDHCRVNSVLTSDAASGQKVCNVVDGTKFSAGMLVKIADNTHWEYNEVDSVSSNEVTMKTNLANTYEVADSGKVWVDLIEKTDTTYTKLDYKDTAAFDIISFIADTADKLGTIGYDFRIAPDAKFEFFPRLSKTSSVDLAEAIETATYKRDITRVRNKIMVFGAAEKAWPLDKDRMTEVLTIGSGQLLYYEDSDLIGYWEEVGYCDVSLDSTRIVGSYSVKLATTQAVASSVVDWYFATGHYLNANEYPSLCFQVKRDTEPGKDGFQVQLYDANDQKLRLILHFDANKWIKQTLKLGLDNADNWTIDEFNTQDFDWSQIERVRFEAFMEGNQQGAFWIDNMFFNHKRWSAVREDAASQTDYGLREYVEIDEELHSDDECDRHAAAILAWKKGYAEYLTVETTILDYALTPILAGDKVHIHLPNELIDADFRVITAEYDLNTEEQKLTVKLELGKEPLQFADYLFGLRRTDRKLARYKIARL